MHGTRRLSDDMRAVIRRGRGRKPTLDREPNGRVRRGLDRQSTRMYGEMTTAIYVMVAGSAVKIGLSVDPGARARDLQIAQEKHVCIHWAVRLEPTAARMVEMEIHRSLKGSKYHASGEWYYLDPEAAKGIVQAEIRKRGVSFVADFSYGYGEV